MTTEKSPTLDEVIAWHRVEDGLPEKQGDYLVRHAGQVRVLFYNEKLREFLYHTTTTEVGPGITHWAPMPKGPKQ